MALLKYKLNGYWNREEGRGRNVVYSVPTGVNYTITVLASTYVSKHDWAGGGDLVVDWDDGTIDTITAATSNIYHAYASAGTYNVKMTSTSDGLLTVDFNSDTKLVSVDASIATNLMTTTNKTNVLTNMFAGCSLLSSLPSVLFSADIPATNATNMFSGATSLTSVSKDLLTNCTSITTAISMFAGAGLTTIDKDYLQPIASTLTLAYFMFYQSQLTTAPSGLFLNCSGVKITASMFNRCANLTSVPGDLLSGLTGITNTSGMFYLCTSLASYPNNIFNGLCASTVDMSNTFSGCTGMTNACDTIWLEYPSATSTNCFDACTNLTNYASIPTAWK